MKYIVLLPILFVINIPQALQAQKQSPYEKVDAYVSSLGSLPGKNVATVTDTLTVVFSDKTDQARALYCWIAHEIALDPKSVRNNDNSKTEPEVVMGSRKSTPYGIAKLFQEMASQAGIRCLSVDGYTRNNAEEIEETPDEMNHCWNVVQLGQSPSQWFYVDVAKACGRLDKKGTSFIKEYGSSYFFPYNKLFNLDHFPDNPAWQLGEGPKNIADFYSLPVLHSACYDLGIRAFQPAKGIIKGKAERTINFTLSMNADAVITSMEMRYGPSPAKQITKPLKFIRSGGDIGFSFIFSEEDEFPLTILANGKELMTYQVMITE